MFVEFSEVEFLDLVQTNCCEKQLLGIVVEPTAEWSCVLRDGSSGECF